MTENDTKFNELISKMTYSELLNANIELQNEIRLSETAINEGMEVKK